MTGNRGYSSEFFSHVARIVAAYVGSRKVSYEEIPAVFKKISQGLANLQGPSHDTSRKPLAIKEPFVPIEESIHDEYIVCLEDGKQLQMLKRHLSTVYGMTIDQYRERWSLPPTYPMVAPKYARRRSDIARNIGLGYKSKKGPKLQAVQGDRTTSGQDQIGIIKTSS